MLYFRNFNSVTRSQRRSRLLCSILAVCAVVFTMFTMLSAPAAAAGGIDFEAVMQLSGYLVKNGASESFTADAYKLNSESGSTPDWDEPDAAALSKDDIPAWNVLVSMSNAQNDIASDYPIVKRCCATASQIVNTFREQPAYQKSLSDLKLINWAYDSSNRSFKVIAAGDQHKFDNALRDFKSSAASCAADNAFSDIYDSQNWDPNAGVAGDFLQSVYGVVNTVFFVVANAMLWFFLLQTGCDVLYIIAEPIRPFIGPRNSSSGISGGSLNNGSSTLLSRIHIPICSSAAEQACNGGGGGIGGNSAGGASAGNAFLSYALKRFPVLICCAVYLILVTLGYWPKLISWVSGFAVDLIDFVMRIGK